MLSSHFMPNVSLVRAVRMVKTATRAATETTVERLARVGAAEHE